MVVLLHNVVQILTATNRHRVRPRKWNSPFIPMRCSAITKDGIFDYVYGVLHAPTYRARFANDLGKELPRIPLAPDFHAFAQAGCELAELHLGYEDCAEYPLEVAFAHSGDPRREHFGSAGRPCDSMTMKRRPSASTSM